MDLGNWNWSLTMFRSAMECLSTINPTAAPLKSRTPLLTIALGMGKVRCLPR